MAEEMEDNVSRETSEEEKDFVVAEDNQSEIRPEWLPEKFKTGEDFAKSYSNLERKLSEGLEEINESVVEGVPESADDYLLPENIDETLAPDNELLNWWANHSHSNNYTQDEFEEGINMYRNAIENAVGGEEIDSEAEMEALGDNAPERLEAVRLFSEQFFTEEEFGEIVELCSTAQGVSAVERMIDALQESGNIDSQPTHTLDEDTLRQMMKDERYWKQGQRDPNFVKEVDEGFEILYSRNS